MALNIYSRAPAEASNPAAAARFEELEVQADSSYSSSTKVEVNTKMQNNFPDLSVGDLARRSGVPVSTIHFYERKGLLFGWRTSGNQRRYPRGVLRRLAIIRIAQRAGIPLEDIRKALEVVPPGRTPTVEQWVRFTAGWRDILEERILSLTQLRDQMTKCIGCGCLSLQDCPLTNPGDVLGEEGPGARRLERELIEKRGRQADPEITDSTS